MSCWQSPGQGHGRARGGERSLGLGEGHLLAQQEQGPRDAGGCQGRTLPHSIANVRGLCWGARQLSGGGFKLLASQGQFWGLSKRFDTITGAVGWEMAC